MFPNGIIGYWSIENIVILVTLGFIKILHRFITDISILCMKQHNTVSGQSFVAYVHLVRVYLLQWAYRSYLVGTGKCSSVLLRAQEAEPLSWS